MIKMTNIVQDFKDFMQEGKHSDEDAQKMFALFKKFKADQQDASTSGTPEVKVPATADQTAASVQTTVETPGTATPEVKEFTMNEAQLQKFVAEQIAAYEAQKVENKAKEQVSFNPIIENERVGKPRYRVLKMKN